MRLSETVDGDAVVVIANESSDVCKKYQSLVGPLDAVVSLF